ERPGCPEKGRKLNGWRQSRSKRPRARRKPRSIRPCRRHRINQVRQWERLIVRWTACSANNGTEGTQYDVTSEPALDQLGRQETPDRRLSINCIDPMNRTV